MVEVIQPYDSTIDYHPYKWLTRYLYDLSGGGTQTLSVPASSATSAASTSPFRAYGNLYDTQTYVDIGFSANDSTPRWIDHVGTSFDAVDRTLSTFDVAIGVAPLNQSAYDQTPSSLGLLSSTSRATGEVTTADYDALGNVVSVTFAYPVGSPANATAAAPSRRYTYDPNRHVTAIDSALGTQSYAYDAAGRVLSTTEPSAQGGSTVSYGYTANGWRSTLSVSGALNLQLFTYSYRPDGMRVQQQVNTNGWKTFTWSFTAGGRVVQRADPTTGLNIHGFPQDGPTAAAFQPLTYSYDASGNLSSVTYSDGYAVNNITTDLEGNRSSELDGQTYTNGSWTRTHVSAARQVSKRDEVTRDESLEYKTITEFANGIPLHGTPGAYNGGPPYRGGVNGNPLGVIASYVPNPTLNALDGFELSTTAMYNSGNAWVDYTKNIVNDASGRLASSDLQQCTPDFQFFTSSGREDREAFTYDAENHTTSQSIEGATNQNPNGPDCTFGPLNSFTYVTAWGMNGHPRSMTWNRTATPAGTGTEYMHWDGDSLLFTSTSPSGGVDDIKIGGFAEVTPYDGNIAVYDRDSSGATIDAHATLPSTQNISYNDVFDQSNWTVLALCSVYGAGPPCIVITEPKPENLAGYAGSTSRARAAWIPR
ncbi:MAG TPA: hypothetical protein VGD01_11435 [Candidatus Elarobacter sp.]